MITIERTKDEKYVVSHGGDIIEEYNQTKMTHPHDWIDDIRDAGYTISGPFDWRYSDSRDSRE